MSFSSGGFGGGVIDSSAVNTPLIYSLDLVKTNEVWIDGLPIWRKGYQTTLPATPDTGKYVDLEVNIQNVIRFFTVCDTNEGTSGNLDKHAGNIFVNDGGITRYSSMVMMFNDNNNYRLRWLIRLFDGASGFASGKLTVIVWFTKRT
jgi:hypothetical protein